nr:MAG TPA: hypothetical protein [Crassvirales sp.]
MFVLKIIFDYRAYLWPLWAFYEVLLYIGRNTRYFKLLIKLLIQ